MIKFVRNGFLKLRQAAQGKAGSHADLLCHVRVAHEGPAHLRKGISALTKKSRNGR